MNNDFKKRKEKRDMQVTADLLFRERASDDDDFFFFIYSLLQAGEETFVF